MGKQFGLEARQHVEDLTGAIRDGNSALQKQVDETARNLQRVARLTEQFEDSLTRALGNATVRSF